MTNDVSYTEIESNIEAHAMNISVYAQRAYLDYAMSVVKGRALPQVQDGLKPVQRRILYAMKEMGLISGAKPVKSARVVGDVLGKYHPHGDIAAYDALVRLAQNFTLRYPLIDGQGNFGSRDGDGAAAMRYTEARLTPIAKILLDELHEGSVDFISNYDGSQQEPHLLPARLPILLLNGATGIAVGMATDIPSHNLIEVANATVAILKNPNLEDCQLMDCISGPDFPGGGQLISSKQEIASAYQTGRGSLRMRGCYQFEELAKGQWQLVFDALPHGVSAAQVLQNMESLTNPVVKLNKKTLSAEQIQLKTLFVQLLDRVRDESGKDLAVRLVFQPKNSRVDRSLFVNSLLKYTCLESSISLNLVCIDLEGRPRQMGLRAIIQQWIDYRKITIRRRSEYHIRELLDRIHVLEGRLLVWLSVDTVIKVIRESDNPKLDLMHSFSLTARQADDILEMRLRQLAKLEQFNLQQALTEANKRVHSLNELLNNPNKLQTQIIKEITQDIKIYGDTRRTLIKESDKAIIETPIMNEPVTVIISRQGWIRIRQGHSHNADTFTYKSGDSAWLVILCQSIDKLYMFSQIGRVYTLAVADLPPIRGDGLPWTALIDAPSNTVWIAVLAASHTHQLVLVTRLGMALRTNVSDIHTTRKQGKQWLDLQANDALAFVLIANIHEIDTLNILSISSENMALIQSATHIKLLSSGGKGVKLQNLEGSTAVSPYISACICLGQSGVIIQGISRQKQIEESYTARQLHGFMGKRGSKGFLLNTRIKQINTVIAQ